MSTSMSACACMGPAGDCPCIRRSKGLPVPIHQAFAPDGWWDHLTDEEKNTINDLKMTAALRVVFAKT